MTRPTGVEIDTQALLHNLSQVKKLAPHSQVIAMVKANAYGCGLSIVAPALAREVDAFGVACLEEAMVIRSLGIDTECILFEGVFASNELEYVARSSLSLVIHSAQQLAWILEKPLALSLKVWVKVNTGMNRLGFSNSEVPSVIQALQSCPWVSKDFGLLTHLSSADEDSSATETQLANFQNIQSSRKKSIANSAAILAFANTHADVVRPGIMLYGVSPFSDRTGESLGLIPVMRFYSSIIAIHNLPVNQVLGYGGKWLAKRPSRIAVVAAGYGDGYPRVVQAGTLVWVNGFYVPIVGRISMDMLTIDITDFPNIKLGDSVELWGKFMPVERIAQATGTIAYELLCQIQRRPTLTSG